MVSAAVLFQNKNKHKIGFRQIFFFVCAVGWFVFVFSSLEYKDRSWFPILISGRIVLLLSAIFICVVTWLRKNIWPNIEISFLLWNLVFQSLCGVLEGENSTEFTNFMSVFITIASVFHRTSQRNWAYKLFPLMFAVTAVPFFFKSAEFFSSIGSFTNQFSAVVSSIFIGFLIGRATAMKNEALLHATNLQEELSKERDQQKKLIEEQARELANARVTARIAQATQMLAHDVRRPFSMLRTAIDLIRNAKSSDQVLARATSLIRDVEESLNNVDNLIGDIIAISKHEPLKTSLIKPETLLGDVIKDTLKQQTQASVEFEFSIKHSKKIRVNEHKIRRVVSNILTNAFQAMDNRGIISISTSDTLQAGSNTVEISIHNSGPPIATEDIPHIFDSFFTRGKQGGTGLGLAIAKTFVEAHAGEIRCESQESHGVRFYFSLEAAGEPYLPESPKVSRSMPIVQEKTFEYKSEAQNRSLIDAVEKKAFHVLIVEDEPIFQQGILDEIDRFFMNGYELIPSVAPSTCIAHNYIEKVNPNLILLDIDLGPFSPDGLQFLREIRTQGNTTFVCILSNRTLFDVGITLKALGANIAVSKPMNNEKLGFIISAAIQKDLDHNNKPKVVVVDDEECYLTEWKETMTDADVIGFLDPEIFWDEIIEKSNVMHNISCIILDFYFQGTDVDKLKLVGSLRTKGFCGPIILSSNAPYDNNQVSQKSRFDYVLKKRAMPFSELVAIPEIANILQKTMILQDKKGMP